MNLETSKNNKAPVNPDMDFDFDFKPITSGLGFHHQKTTEAKSFITERKVAAAPTPTLSTPKKEMNIYQNDLSLFYGQELPAEETMALPETKITNEKVFVKGTAVERSSAYILDLLLITSILGMVMTVMARTISMDLMEVWTEYPNEITPLVLTLFCGFYLMYFSIFEKTENSTLGKNLFGLRVTGTDHKSLSLVTLVMRTTISLLNFASLGLFSYFDLQNKATSSKVVRVK